MTGAKTAYKARFLIDGNQVFQVWGLPDPMQFQVGECHNLRGHDYRVASVPQRFRITTVRLERAETGG